MVWTEISGLGTCYMIRIVVESMSGFPSVVECWGKNFVHMSAKSVTIGIRARVGCLIPGLANYPTHHPDKVLI